MSNKVKKQPHKPHKVDEYVGAQLRKRRQALGISQSELAAHVGLTFQQVQKYEKGLNRVSSSKLFEFATFLKTSVQYFFEGLPKTYQTEKWTDNLYLDDNATFSDSANDEYIASENSDSGEVEGRLKKPDLDSHLEMLFRRVATARDPELKKSIAYLLTNVLRNAV